MDNNPQIGGACGEIEVFEPNDRELGYGYNRITDAQVQTKLNDVNQRDDYIKSQGKRFEKREDGIWYEFKRRTLFQRFEARCMIIAQYVEYKISHYLDKSFESLFGFVSVLPGAF